MKKKVILSLLVIGFIVVAYVFVARVKDNVKKERTEQAAPANEHSDEYLKTGISADRINVIRESDEEHPAPVIEVTADPDQPLPSYAKPECYNIVKQANGKYSVMLPGGNQFGDIFDTEEEAQDYIKECANASRRKFIESNGTNF